MKKLFGILIVLITFNKPAFAVSDYNLSGIYNSCRNAGYSHKICKCYVEVVDEKLTNREYEKLALQSWKYSEWMKENAFPICR